MAFRRPPKLLPALGVNGNWHALQVNEGSEDPLELGSQVGRRQDTARHRLHSLRGNKIRISSTPGKKTRRAIEEKF